MTAIICAIAITMTPAPADCQRGGHARSDFGQRGGLAVAVLEPVGSVPNWVCIHNGEGAWNDTGDPYWGGLQMDRGFMGHYGRDMIAKHHGWANTWTPREQMVVAERARSGSLDGHARGYGPWPVTARRCGLL